MAHPVSIVIAENGSDWTPWAARLPRAAKMCILVQDAGETPRCFAARVRERLLAIAPTAPLGDAVIAGGPGSDLGVLEARTAILRFLRARAPRGHVWLDARGASRRAMEALRLSFEEIAGGPVRAVECAEPGALGPALEPAAA